MWRSSYLNEEWERRKAFILRSFFEDAPSRLSTVYDTDESRSTSPCSDLPPEPLNGTALFREHSPLPELIIERVPKVDRHDEPEEFYQNLEITVRKYIAKLKRGDPSDCDSELSATDLIGQDVRSSLLENSPESCNQSKDADVGYHLDLDNGLEENQKNGGSHNHSVEQTQTGLIDSEVSSKDTTIESQDSVYERQIIQFDAEVHAVDANNLTDDETMKLYLSEEMHSENTNVEGEINNPSEDNTVASWECNNGSGSPDDMEENQIEDIISPHDDDEIVDDATNKNIDCEEATNAHNESVGAIKINLAQETQPENVDDEGDINMPSENDTELHSDAEDQLSEDNESESKQIQEKIAIGPQNVDDMNENKEPEQTKDTNLRDKSSTNNSVSIQSHHSVKDNTDTLCEMNDSGHDDIEQMRASAFRVTGTYVYDDQMSINSSDASVPDDDFMASRDFSWIGTFDKTSERPQTGEDNAPFEKLQSLNDAIEEKLPFNLNNSNVDEGRSLVSSLEPNNSPSPPKRRRSTHSNTLETHPKTLKTHSKQTQTHSKSTQTHTKHTQKHSKQTQTQRIDMHEVFITIRCPYFNKLCKCKNHINE